MKEKNPKMRKAYQAVVGLDEKALEQIMFLSRVIVRLWNMALEQSEIWLNDKSQKISNVSFNYWLTGVRQTIVKLDDGTEVEMGAVSSDCEREILLKLAGSWQSYFQLKKNGDQRARKPRSRKEERFQAISWSSFSIRNGAIFLPASSGEKLEIRLTPYLQEKIDGKNVVHATISQNEKREFVLNLVTASPLPSVISEPKFFRAIDLGAGDVAVTDSDGSEFLIPARRPDKYWMDQIRQVEARQENRVRGSRGYERLAKARRTMHGISEDQKKDHQRKLAHALLEPKVECITIGKPKTRLGLSQSESGTSEQHYGVQNTGYMFRLLLFIKEKAQEQGVLVIELPDPKREGVVIEPESKFRATRTLLEQGMKSKNQEPPKAFVRKKFSFNQGKGQKPSS